jgi:hypothetical protein
MPRKRVCPEFSRGFGEYPKDLLEPIVRQQRYLGLLAGEDEKKRRSEEERNRIQTALFVKLRLLAKHFHIKWDNDKSWRQLATALALAHVPGMQITDAPKKRRGRSKRHGPIFLQVEAIREERNRGVRDAMRNRGVSDAIRIWKIRNKSKDPERRLRARYYRERRRIKDVR